MKRLVEVAGIEPASLSNHIKTTTCVDYLLMLVRLTPVNGMHSDYPFVNLAPHLKAR